MLEIAIRQQLGAFQLQVQVCLPASGVTAIFGASGAGKTSLINAISGLTRPEYGRIVLNGHILNDSQQQIFLPPEKRRIGYVFQDARLFPHYRVAGNLQYGMTVRQQKQFDSVVALLGLKPLLHRFPATLSGGEKQRVALGRALLSEPQMLLLDEPLASLDTPRQQELLCWLQQLSQQVAIPFLYVSHNQEEIIQLARHLLVLDAGQVIADGPLESLWNSGVMRSCLANGELSSVLSVQVLDRHPHYPMTALALEEQTLWVPCLSAPPGSRLRVRVFSSDVSLTLIPSEKSSVLNTLRMQVMALLEINQQVEVKLQQGKTILWARISLWACDELAIRTGLSVYVQIKNVAVTRISYNN